MWKKRSQCWQGKTKDFSSKDGYSREMCPTPTPIPRAGWRIQGLTESTVVLQLVGPSSQSLGRAKKDLPISFIQCVYTRWNLHNFPMGPHRDRWSKVSLGARGEVGCFWDQLEEGTGGGQGQQLRVIRRMRDWGESLPGTKVKHLNSQKLRQTKLFAVGAKVRNSPQEAKPESPWRHQVVGGTPVVSPKQSVIFSRSFDPP